MKLLVVITDPVLMVPVRNSNHGVRSIIAKQSQGEATHDNTVAVGDSHGETVYAPASLSWTSTLTDESVTDTSLGKADTNAGGVASAVVAICTCAGTIMLLHLGNVEQ